jgi:hypothetical protein
MMGQFWSRAASREATTVEEEVTFWSVSYAMLSSGVTNKRKTYNGGNGKLLLLSILEELEDVIADDDTSLAGQLLEDTHVVLSVIIDNEM